MLWGRVTLILLIVAAAARATPLPDEELRQVAIRKYDAWRQAANQGDPGSTFNIGLCYDHGFVVRQDSNEAMQYYLKAARLGVAEANTNMGQLYEHGRGVPANDAEAFKWYARGAEGGHNIAMGNLALCYATGRGVKRDGDLAKQWFDRAAAAGYPIRDQWQAEHPWRKLLLPRDRSVLLAMIGIVAASFGARIVRRERTDPTLPAPITKLAGLGCVLVGIAGLMYGAWSFSAQLTL